MTHRNLLIGICLGLGAWGAVRAEQKPAFALAEVRINRGYNFFPPSDKDVQVTPHGPEVWKPGANHEIVVQVKRDWYDHELRLRVQAPAGVSDGENVTLRGTAIARWQLRHKIPAKGVMADVGVGFRYLTGESTKLEGTEKEPIVAGSYERSALSEVQVVVTPADGTFRGADQATGERAFHVQASSTIQGSQALIDVYYLYRQSTTPPGGVSPSPGPVAAVDAGTGASPGSPAGDPPGGGPPVTGSDAGAASPAGGSPVTPAAGQPDTATPGSSNGFDGIWVGPVSGPWTFRQSGTTVTGTIVNLGGKFGRAKVTGVTTGPTMNGTWESASAKGTITLRVSHEHGILWLSYTVDQPGGMGGQECGGVARAEPGALPPDERTILLAPHVVVPRGASVLVPVLLLQGRDLLNMAIELRYQPEVATAGNSGERGSVITNISEVKQNGPGLFKFAFAQLTPFHGSGTVMGFRFDATGPGRSRTPLGLTAVNADDSRGARVPLSVVDGSITIYDPDDLDDPNNPRNPRSNLQPTCSGTGIQTVADAQCCLKMWVGLTPVGMQMDVNGDGAVDSRDAVRVLQNVAERLQR